MDGQSGVDSCRADGPLVPCKCPSPKPRGMEERSGGKCSSRRRSPLASAPAALIVHRGGPARPEQQQYDILRERLNIFYGRRSIQHLSPAATPSAGAEQPGPDPSCGIAPLGPPQGRQRGWSPFHLTEPSFLSAFEHGELAEHWGSKSAAG